MMVLVPSLLTVVLATVLSVAFRYGVVRYAPSEKHKAEALARSRYAVPFWSVVLALLVVRTFFSVGILGDVYGGGSGGRSGGGGGGIVSLSLVFGAWGTSMAALRGFVMAARDCLVPAMAWLWIGVVVAMRYTGPFRPVVRCSGAPLRASTWDAKVRVVWRTVTSKERCLDALASLLSWLASLSFPDSSPPPPKTGVVGAKPLSASGDGTSVATAVTSSSSSSFGRYIRPPSTSVVVQCLLHASGGYALAILLLRWRFFPTLDTGRGDAESAFVLSCVLSTVAEFYSSTVDVLGGTARHELHPRRCFTAANVNIGGGASASSPSSRRRGGGAAHPYSSGSVKALLSDAVRAVRGAVLGPAALLAPLLANALVLFDGDDAAASVTTASLASSFVLSLAASVVVVAVLAVQDVFVRWAVCAPGLDPDALLFRLMETTSGKQNKTSLSTSGNNNNVANNNVANATQNTFLAEDLFIASLLDGDRDAVLRIVHPSTNRHDGDELLRQDDAANRCAARMIAGDATPTTLADEVLRTCLLESLGGGGGSNSSGNDSSSFAWFHLGDERHRSACLRRLELSAAAFRASSSSYGTSSNKEAPPQPVALPLVRALCAYAAGSGVAAHRCFAKEKKKVVGENSQGGANKNKKEAWALLPPGALTSAEHAILAAARMVVLDAVSLRRRGSSAPAGKGEYDVPDADIVVMVDPSKRHGRLSPLLPCVLRAAYVLRVGMMAYAEHHHAAASSSRKTGNNDKEDVGNHVGNQSSSAASKAVESRPEIGPVLLACDNAARMVAKVLVVESGDALRSSGDDGGNLRAWLADLMCEGNNNARK